MEELNWNWTKTLLFLFFSLNRLSTSYEDGQVGDTSINTQDPGIHREILRVIGNQTATGWKSLNTIRCLDLFPKAGHLSVGGQYHVFFGNHMNTHINTHTHTTKKIFAIFKIHYLYCSPGIHAYLHWLIKLLPFC